MTVRWFVDGAEVAQARGAYRHELLGDGVEHRVRVTVEDTSGSIRAPAANEHRGEVVWRVSATAGKDMQKAQVGPARIGGWIRMQVDATGHRVLGTLPAEPQRVARGYAQAESDMGYALYDGNGAMLAEGPVGDPRLVHGPLAPPDAPVAGHAVGTLQSGYYLIGIPEGVDARKLRIRRSDGSMEKATLSEQWLDL
jgi:hypothetical protein